MPFVKLDCGLLNSSLWVDRPARELFITALLMARPYFTTKAVPQISVNSLDNTGWLVPPGEYGLVEAAGCGIIVRAHMSEEEGREALIRLGEPDKDSRSDAFDGRRLVRIDGGYLVLNYMTYRDKDYTAATRSARYRAKKKSHAVTDASHGVTTRNVTHADAEAYAEAYAEGEGTIVTIGSPAPVAPTAPSIAAHSQGQNKPTLEQAIKYFVPTTSYREEEVREAYRQFEVNQREDGFWMWGHRPVGDWRAALEERMSSNCEKRKGNKPPTDALAASLRAISKLNTK